MLTKAFEQNIRVALINEPVLLQDYRDFVLVMNTPAKTLIRSMCRLAPSGVGLILCRWASEPAGLDQRIADRWIGMLSKSASHRGLLNSRQLTSSSTAIMTSAVSAAAIVFPLPERIASAIVCCLALGIEPTRSASSKGIPVFVIASFLFPFCHRAIHIWSHRTYDEVSVVLDRRWRC